MPLKTTHLSTDPDTKREQVKAMRDAEARRSRAWFLKKKKKWTYLEIAEHLGCSRQRAHELVKRHEELSA